MPRHNHTKKAFAGKNTSTVLSTGGSLAVSDRTHPITVDKSNAQRLLKKPIGQGSPGALDSFNMWKPSSSTDANSGSASRKRCAPTDATTSVHSDPFAADRAHYEPPVKKLLETKRTRITDHHVGACRRHIDSATKDGQDKEKLITANGNVHRGGKHFQEGVRTSDSTFDKVVVKKVDYSNHSRFGLAVAARKNSLVTSPLRNHPDGAKFANASAAPGHAHGIKRVAGSPDNVHSLVGVLRLDGQVKQAKSHKNRPPWATNTPRTTAPSGGDRYSANANAPFATATVA